MQLNDTIGTLYVKKRGALFISDKNVGESRTEKMVVTKFSSDEIFDVGMDMGSFVRKRYKLPNSQAGTRRKWRSIRNQKAEDGPSPWSRLEGRRETAQTSG